MTRNRRVMAVVALVTVGVGVLMYASDHCLRARLRYGVDIDRCPDGEVAVGVDVVVNGLKRGEPGSVTVSGRLLYALARQMDVFDAPLDDYDLTLTVKRGDTDVPIVVEPREVRRQRASRTIPLTLPLDLPDGDYLLTATITASAGTATATAPLALYAPARVHVATDRPLYEPGNTILYRAVLLRAANLTPLDGRPGRFKVIDPAGVVVLDERSDAIDFGVAAGEFPLDATAPEGTWHVRYDSGDASDDVTVEVRPFTLPRFTVSAEPSRPFYGAGDEPRLRLSVRTAAGVPLAATLRLDWRVQGAWPAPPEWLAALPTSLRLPSSGTTTMVMGPVPADLVGKASVVVTATATDDTGDEETGSGVVLLAKDAIDVAVVTELGQGEAAGLVEGSNNRVYLRATTAAGQALPGASLTMTRAWDKKDKGTVAVCDEDGVAVLQFDPGPAVNVVIPPMPVRLPPPPPEVMRSGAEELVRRGSPSLPELTALDALNPVVAPCSRFVGGDQGQVEVTLQVSPSGSIDNATGDGDVGRCVADALRGRRLSSGAPRLFQLRYLLRPPLASLTVERTESKPLPDVVNEALTSALLDARSCLGRSTTASRLPELVSWQVVGGRFSSRTFTDDAEPAVARLVTDSARCVMARVQTALRDRSLDVDAADLPRGDQRYGLLRLAVKAVRLPGSVSTAMAQTRLGYEMLVTATTATSATTLGSTRIFVAPGVVPPLRLRATPVVAAPGDTVVIDLVRGPDFAGELPRKLTLSSTHHGETVDVDQDKRRATFTLPKDQDGWYEARVDGAIARVFVPRRSQLSVQVSPDKPVYRPGETATLGVRTTSNGGVGADGVGIAAAVSLFGVDDTLGQLAPLLGPSAMDRLVPTVTMQQPAFGVLDAMALSLGRVRGANAAAATVLFVASVPTPEALDVRVSSQGQSSFDPLLPLADRFYGVLDALFVEVRHFEGTAPAADKLTPATMLALWSKALQRAKDQGVITTDAFGRPLLLQALPDELVAMADPRLLVRDGTRLTEDVEAWVPFVRNNGGAR